MKKLLLNPEDSWHVRPQEQVESLIDCFRLHGIETTQQQAILLWERISKEIYNVYWIRVPQEPEKIWVMLQGNRGLWQVEQDV